MQTVEGWRSALRAALKEAMRARDVDRTAVLREALAAIDNAEAAASTSAPPIEDGVIAGGVAGLGAGDVPRRALTGSDVAAIIDREIRERLEAAATYVKLGRTDQSDRLAQQVEVLRVVARAGPSR